MTVTAALLATLNEAAARTRLPPVRALHIPARQRDPGMESEFGLVVLEDGSAGLFFAMLGDTLARLQAAVHGEDPAGRSPLALASTLQSDDPVARAVALGTVCAVSQHVFRRAGYAPPAAANSLGGTDFAPTDHVGMVGLFPSLADSLRARGIRLTVLELRADKVQEAAGFRVTLDPEALRTCNRILCTASTLINGSLDDVLAHCRHAQHIALIGPSASCLPDALFARGVHVVGGTAVLDADALAARLAAGEKWGPAVRRYAIAAHAYPGLDALLLRC